MSAIHVSVFWSPVSEQGTLDPKVSPSDRRALPPLRRLHPSAYQELAALNPVPLFRQLVFTRVYVSRWTKLGLPDCIRHPRTVEWDSRRLALRSGKVQRTRLSLNG